MATFDELISSNLTSFDGSNFAKFTRLSETLQKSRKMTRSVMSTCPDTMALRRPEKSANLLYNLTSCLQCLKKGCNASSVLITARFSPQFFISADFCGSQFFRHKSSKILLTSETSRPTLLFLSAFRILESNCSAVSLGSPLKPF